jgi:hypothetical protein
MVVVLLFNGVII